MNAANRINELVGIKTDLIKVTFSNIHIIYANIQWDSSGVDHRSVLPNQILMY